MPPRFCFKWRALGWVRNRSRRPAGQQKAANKTTHPTPPEAAQTGDPRAVHLGGLRLLRASASREFALGGDGALPVRVPWLIRAAWVAEAAAPGATG